MPCIHNKLKQAKNWEWHYNDIMYSSGNSLSIKLAISKINTNKTVINMDIISSPVAYTGQVP